MSEAIIQTQGLTKRFSDHLAVDGLDLSVAPGEALALLGPNGAGKTTTVRMLTCLISPTSGSAQVLGQDINDPRGQKIIRGGVGLLTESPGLYDRATAWYNLLYFARLYGLSKPEKAVEKFLKMLDLWQRRNELTASFSKGLKQRLVIARALIHEPDLIFLDEPTSGLDPSASHRLREFLIDLKAQGRTILLTTHNLAEAEKLADRIIFIKTRLIAAETATELRKRLFGHRTLIRCGPISGDVLASVEKLPFVSEVQYEDSTLAVSVDLPEEHNPILVATLVAGGVSVRWVQEEKATLEDIYLELLDSYSEAEKIPDSGWPI